MFWNNKTSENHDRKPAVAGQFYPADSAELKKTVLELFDQAKPKLVNNVQAVISPHAGYVFSGQVAASSFNQIDPDRKFDNIFLIGTSHHTYLPGASIYDQGDYIMPFGKIKVNTKLAHQLIEKYPFFTFDPQAHLYEHTLEVQLPFLYYHLKHQFQIIPIIIGTNDINTIKQIAHALEPYFNKNNLFVISTDFSHYPPYQDAIKVDSLTAQSIISKDPQKFLETIQNNEKLGIPNLATSICGWSSVLTLMFLAQNNPNLKFKIIEYKNSGDSPYGNHTQVVGYYSIVLYYDSQQKQLNKKEESDIDFSLSENDKITLLKLARQTLNSYIINGTVPKINPSELSDNLKKPLGAFVTLKIDDKLRGCIGRFMPNQPLYQVVQDMTVAAATQDPRFIPVSTQELKLITIEISVLTPLKPISSLDQIIIGKHGIYCKQGFNSGTLLPQVATENNWDVEQFVGYCCKYKAGLNWDCWKTAQLYTYEAIVFDEKEFGLTPQ